MKEFCNQWTRYQRSQQVCVPLRVQTIAESLTCSRAIAVIPRMGYCNPSPLIWDQRDIGYCVGGYYINLPFLVWYHLSGIYMPALDTLSPGLTTYEHMLMFMFMFTHLCPHQPIQLGPDSPSSILMQVPTKRGLKAAHRPWGRKLSPFHPGFLVSLRGTAGGG